MADLMLISCHSPPLIIDTEIKTVHALHYSFTPVWAAGILAPKPLFWQSHSCHTRLRQQEKSPPRHSAHLLSVERGLSGVGISVIP